MRQAWMVGAAAIVVAAGCNKAPAPMTDAERAALADSVSQKATEMVASFATGLTAEKALGYYVRGNDLVHAGYGMIFPTYDSLVKVAHAIYLPGSSVQATLDQRRLTVLDRDVVVLTALLNGAFKDSAGKETPLHFAWTGVWHRTSDGWKIAADHESATPPPAPAKKPSRRAR